MKAKNEEKLKIPYKLPKSWKWAEIKEVIKEIQTGFACSKKYESSPEKGGIPHLRPNNIGFDGRLDLSKIVYIPKEKIDLSKYSIKKGDVLFNNTNSKELVGRAALVEETLNCGFSNHITRLRVYENLITPEWLTLSMNYLWIQGYFLKICQKWIGQAGVNAKMLKSIPIPLPPLPEQKRIVARIEELFSKIDEVKKLRKEALEQTKTLLKATLHKIFSKANEKGWRWVKLGEVVEHKTGIWGEGDANPENGYPILRSTNIVNWKLNLENIAYRRVDPQVTEIGKYVLQDGDIIVTKSSGSAHLVGEAAVFYHPPKGPKFFLFSNFTLRLRPAKGVISPEFLHYYLMSPLAREVFEEMHRTTSGLRNLKTKAYLNQSIPLPPLPEQRRIVAYLDKIQQKVQSLQALQETTEEEIKKLKESILHKAFRGEL